jgi:hypothetical protein
MTATMQRMPIVMVMPSLYKMVITTISLLPKSGVSNYMKQIVCNNVTSAKILRIDANGVADKLRARRPQRC